MKHLARLVAVSLAVLIMLAVLLAIPPARGDDSKLELIECQLEIYSLWDRVFEQAPKQLEKRMTFQLAEAVRAAKSDEEIKQIYKDYVFARRLAWPLFTPDFYKQTFIPSVHKTMDLIVTLEDCKQLKTHYQIKTSEFLDVLARGDLDAAHGD